MNELLGTLVKLASVGASGICIFAIFWIGWLIIKLPNDANPERYRTLRFFMVACIAIALVSAGSGVANALIDAGKIKTLSEDKQGLEKEKGTLTEKVTTYDKLTHVLEGDKARLSAENTAFKATLDKQERLLDMYKANDVKNKEVAESLRIVLASKEADALRTGSAEIKGKVEMLKKSIDRLEKPAVVNPP